jgi:hypothetical protein
VVAAAALLAVVGAADPARPVFGAGVLRRDGVIIPFAAFDGKKWVATWSAPTRKDLTVPINLRSVPKSWWGPTGALETWQVWTQAGTRAATVVQPDWVDVHCVRQIGLRTDYRTPAATVPLRAEQPYPKDGLAISPAQPVEPIRILEPNGSEARSLIPAVFEAFNRGEREVEERFGHPFPRRSREGVEPDIEAVYAYGDAFRVYYVEATRRYRHLGSSECSTLAFGTGWFTRIGNTVTTLEMAVDVLACTRPDASYMLPLGAMRIDNRLFWIAQFSGWNNERFAVIEIKPKTVEALVGVWGGGC